MDKERKLALLKAWEQIEDFTKENYDNVFDEGLEFRYNDGIYGWGSFGIDKNGNPYLVSGSHGTISMNKYFNHPLHENRMSVSIIEKVISNWDLIKRRLEGAKKREENIYNFKV